jgi:ferric-dicitrate binding protein FerR (iron transport regulator)
VDTAPKRVCEEDAPNASTLKKGPSRAELQLDGSVIRLASSSELSFVNLTNEVTQIRLTSGTLLLRVRRLDDNETYEVDTPNLAFTVPRP